MKVPRPALAKPARGRTRRLDEALWQCVLDTARDAIISIDPKGRITLFNREAERMFGLSAKEVIGKDVTLLMPSPYRENHSGYIRHYQETGVAKAIGRIRHVEALRKNGEVFPVELSVSEAKVGRQVLYTAIMRDVSERRRAETTLRELRELAQRRERLADIGAITAQIVHDLGNPLAAISMQGQLIVRRAKRDGAQPVETVLKPAEQIVARVSALDTLIREFLDFAREQRLNLVEISMRPFLESLVELWEPLTSDRKILLSLELPVPDVMIEGDVEKLGRVLDNIVKNAMEAIDTSTGGITISVSLPNPEKVRISVADSGPGIPESIDVFRLFETTKPAGTGLGLPIARQIIQAHGGSIDYQQGERGGTVFHIDLPRSGHESKHDGVTGR